METPSLTYEEFIPSVGLRPYIEKIWVLKGAASNALSSRVLPSSSGHVFFHFEGLFRRWDADQKIVYEDLISGVAGPNTECFYIKPKDRIYTLGVRFHPFGLQPLLKVPLKQLTNRIGALSEVLWNFKPWDLDGLYQAKEIRNQIVLLEQFVMKMIEQSEKVDELVISIIKDAELESGHVSSEYLARKYGISRRQLENRFKNITGITHQRFNRLSRFHNLLNHFKLQPHRSMTELGYEMGYCDQPHFIRDFAALTHTSPGKFFRTHRLMSDYLTARI